MNENFTKEYDAVRKTGAGIFEFPQRGLIEVSGGEAVQFLNGLITNDVKTLENNRWMFAAFPNAQGRLLALVRVLRRADKFLFDVDAANYASILQNLMRFTFAGDFKVADLTNEFALIALQGARSLEITEKVFNARVPTEFQISNFKFQNQEVTGFRGFYAAPEGVDFIASKNVIAELITEFERAGAIKMGDEAREVLRVEMGTMRYGDDVDEATVVLETGVDAAVSFTKGCYIGQEIIARIHFRGHVAKQLTGLVLEENAEIAAGDQLKSLEGKVAGRITSTVFSPTLGKQIALAVVRYEFLPPETKLLIERDGKQIPARVVELPFIK